MPHKTPQSAQNPALATDTTEGRLQNMHPHPQMLQQTSSSLSPKPNTRENNNSSLLQIGRQKKLCWQFQT